MGGKGGGRAAPVWRGNEPKKTGARSARARTRGQNPLVFQNIIYVLGLDPCIWFGIKMKSRIRVRIRIGIETMPIHMQK